MTHAAIAQTTRTAAAAGDALADSVLEQFDGARPDAVIVFATPEQDHRSLLSALSARLQPAALIGCSSAGEFTSGGSGVGLTCVLALRSGAGDMRFRSVIGRGLRADRAAAADALAAGFTTAGVPGLPHRSALVLTDALAGFADDLVDRLTLRTGGIYRFFGGGAGDDARFERTHVFHGREVVSDAVVALEILSSKPIGIGVSHGWKPGGERMRVTESSGMRLGSLNAAPAAEAFAAHAAATGQPFDRAEPVPFFLHNVLGVESAQGYRLRVPLGIDEAGGVACAANVPPGATSCIMTTRATDAADAAASATRAALDQLGGEEPAVALLFDCVATRLRLGAAFADELAAVARELSGTPFVGFNTYGQIAQAEGQFSGFHNCTAVVCVLPR